MQLYMSLLLGIQVVILFWLAHKKIIALYRIIIYKCKYIQKKGILSLTIVSCSMPEARLRRVTPQAEPNDPPVPRPKCSRRQPARYVHEGEDPGDDPSIGSTLAAFTATMLEQQKQFLDALSGRLQPGGMEQPSASCTTTTNDADVSGQCVTPTGATKPASTSSAATTHQLPGTSTGTELHHAQVQSLGLPVGVLLLLKLKEKSGSMNLWTCLTSCTRVKLKLTMSSLT